MDEALMALVERGTLEQTLEPIVRAFSRVIGAEAAVLITFDASGQGVIAAATNATLAGATWRLGPTFERALKRGRPIAAFETAAMPEWREQAEDVLAVARSA